MPAIESEGKQPSHCTNSLASFLYAFPPYCNDLFSTLLFVIAIKWDKMSVGEIIVHTSSYDYIT